MLVNGPLGVSNSVARMEAANTCVRSHLEMAMAPCRSRTRRIESASSDILWLTICRRSDHAKRASLVDDQGIANSRWSFSHGACSGPDLWALDPQVRAPSSPGRPNFVVQDERDSLSAHPTTDRPVLIWLDDSIKASTCPHSLHATMGSASSANIRGCDSGSGPFKLAALVTT